MAVKPDAVKARWEKLRKEPKADLSLSPEFVSRLIDEKSGSDLVQDKIIQALTHLANYRLEKGKFVNEPRDDGPMVICEGLEAFFVPAVERAISLSAFLKDYKRSKDIVKALVDDFNSLLDVWEEGFSGIPYIDESGLQDCIKTDLVDNFETINITEAAAIASRVLIHLLTLLNRSGEERFYELIANLVDEEKMTGALQKAITFIVDAFQSKDVKTNPIGSATYDGKAEGSGWSWTNWPGLRPMLFFSAAVVDAFAELDLYLIRAAQEKGCPRVIADFYKDNKELLSQYEFCVDMARRWVIDEALPEMARGTGLYVESEVDILKEDIIYRTYGSGLYQVNRAFADQLAGGGYGAGSKSPLILYYNLYALLILLWSYADWNDDGSAVDGETLARIERSLLQLIVNYKNNDVLSDILKEYGFRFYLPGNVFIADQTETEMKARLYYDAAFLPLLTRLLVLYVASGAGDRNILDPLISELYIDLLLNRNQKRTKYAYLWSAQTVEVFSTQRALQALTFFYTYLKGKEKAQALATGEGGVDLIDLFTQVVDRLKETDRHSRKQEMYGDEEKKEEERSPLPEGFLIYVAEHRKKEEQVAIASEEGQVLFMDTVEKTGDGILEDYKNELLSYEDTKILLDQCVALASNPWDKEGLPKTEELKALQQAINDRKASK